MDIPLDHTCAHCHDPITGEAWIDRRNRIVHRKCRIDFEFAERGLVHPCPKCKERGTIDHPTAIKHIERPLRDNEEPDCGCNETGSMRGCIRCANRITFEDAPVQIKCPLCKGAKRLRHPPKPITAVVDWTLGSPTKGCNPR